MHTNKVTVGFITVLVIPCRLALGGFASPALAKNIVVTTLTDTADPPFDADGPCGTGTISDLPGADGEVSLREAIIASNNTLGADSITFLRGGPIKVNFDDLDADGDPDPLPLLCGGHTRIDGDLNGDNVPDITLEGSALPAFVPAAGIGVISSHNTIQGLQVQHFPLGIVVTSLASDTQITHTTVTHNEVRENGFVGIYMLSLGDRNVLSHATFARNTVASNGGAGILIQGGFGGADENTFEADIKDNIVTENGFAGIEVLGGVENSSNNYGVAWFVATPWSGGTAIKGSEPLQE
jgi:Right handed beta helix region